MSETDGTSRDGGAGDTVAVLDFGGQYTHLIARRIRNLGVFSRVFEPEDFVPEEHPEVCGIVFSGGPGSVTEEGFRTVRFAPLGCAVPILGLCYGHQLLARLCGGTVATDGRRGYGLAEVSFGSGEGKLFRGLPSSCKVWMSHGDHVETLPPRLTVTATTPTLPVAGFQDGAGRLFGLQFHPEVTHTRHGREMLDNFLAACRAPRTWNPRGQRARLVERIRREAGGRPLFLLISGGADSR
ncbi:MAG: glutamine-hydrolyzing GMP synthase, partial [Deltaproteobacteria bacterium]|nr:glutamine-hydrolyzing GMP synthase [Deltaproteobacteria bacterium]